MTEEEFKYLQRMASIECLEEAGFTKEEIDIILNADNSDEVIEAYFERR